MSKSIELTLTSSTKGFYSHTLYIYTWHTSHKTNEKPGKNTTQGGNGGTTPLPLPIRTDSLHSPPPNSSPFTSL